MKESYDNLNKLQKEALINEYKGNLFEYLVAHYAARQLGCEASFLQSFGGEEKQRLQTYELWLRENDRNCLLALPALAQKSSQVLEKYLGQQNLADSLVNILVIGKKWGGKSQFGWEEADLLLVHGEDRVQGVSLKLCKGHAYVNTKSGGARSFIEKYFSPFPCTKTRQDGLNKQLDQSFIQLGQELYQRAELGDFPGRFDERWVAAGFSELPGELPDEFRSLVQASYAQAIAHIHQTLVELQENDPGLFTQCLYSLLGFGHQGMWQLMCFYQGEYQFSHCDFVTEVEQLFAQQDVVILPLQKDLGSFEIEIGEVALQIRVKPMNKFTASAHKINCSLKRKNKRNGKNHE